MTQVGSEELEDTFFPFGEACSAGFETVKLDDNCGLGVVDRQQCGPEIVKVLFSAEFSCRMSFEEPCD